MFLNSSKVLKESVMSTAIIRFPFPKEATVYGQLLMFFTESEFKKKLRLESIPSPAVRDIFRTWALCFRDAPYADNERISPERLLCAADFSVVRWQHEHKFADKRLASASEIKRRNKVLWYWMIVVARRLFCKRYKGFLAEMMGKLASPEFCIHLTTWDPEWMDEIRSKWSA